VALSEIGCGPHTQPIGGVTANPLLIAAAPVMSVAATMILSRYGAMLYDVGRSFAGFDAIVGVAKHLFNDRLHHASHTRKTRADAKCSA
jgi:hypothetical protein